ncbi:hypothetical protein [Paracoccus sp. S1E-3]|uniref:hypothetical protein n=1 Tax=Paracoccus sp. S1E-3 TaxID=2756130 RepID=UPI0015EEDAD0|nr:hypothetical protein [Paracoccus sp. S1E-3]MBA4491192.1 hypothetical protein [Paracoccus sp. S1E-3]
MRRVILMLLCLALPFMAQAQDRPRAGLIWNRSGLPATLPLQVRSPAGRDHLIVLTPTGKDAPEIAGFIRGGEFFRLLVPPGDWTIRIASGTDWQDEDTLFGPETTWAALTAPLNFSAGKSRLNGHVLTLEDGAITVAPQTICQLPSWQADLFDAEDPVGGQPREPQPLHPPKRPSYTDPPPAPIHQPPLSYPDRELRLRSVICD